MRVWIVLPSYNEARNLAALLGDCRQVATENHRLDTFVLVIDDGSTDDTVAVAEREARTLALEVIRNVTNRGLAATFSRGMTEAARRASPGDVVVCMDADNSHSPGLIPRMIAEIERGCDVVIASRYRPGAVIAGVPWFRRFLSRGMSLIFRIVLPIQGVRDYSCGYRAYRAAFFQKALETQGERLFTQDGFACMTGILLHLAGEGATFGEVPLVLRYDQKIGASKMKVGRTVLRTLHVLVRERFARR